jgi:hypothetical protein
MKKIFITAIIILVTAGVYAQAGMPKELTCTEEAFNFSFGLGTKWKFSTPKMGPVEIIGSEPDYIPAWAFKIKNVAPKTHFSPLFEMPFNAATADHSTNEQYTLLSFHNNLSVMYKPTYLLPAINFNPFVNYTLLKPSLQ